MELLVEVPNESTSVTFIEPDRIHSSRISRTGIVMLVLSIVFCIAFIFFLVKTIHKSKALKKMNQDEEKEQFQKVKKSKILCFILMLISLLLSALFGVLASENNVVQMYDYGIKKPIIYLYPIEETTVSVLLGNSEKITCSYPKYIDGWNVIAKPNGDLVDLDSGRNLYSLYWEGLNTISKSNIKEGFCVKGEDTASFLEEKLAILGLNEREAEEFIVYWLPRLEANKYNLIRFQTMEEIENYMPLVVTPAPDTTIRIMMEWRGVNKCKEIPEQELITPEREGFVVVEWGGTER